MAFYDKLSCNLFTIKKKKFMLQACLYLIQLSSPKEISFFPY